MSIQLIQSQIIANTVELIRDANFEYCFDKINSGQSSRPSLARKEFYREIDKFLANPVRYISRIKNMPEDWHECPFAKHETGLIGIIGDQISNKHNVYIWVMKPNEWENWMHGKKKYRGTPQAQVNVI